MVNARLLRDRETSVFFAIPRHFDFLDCETETSKCFECERRRSDSLKIRAPDLVESYENELEGTYTEVSQRSLLLLSLVRDIRSENILYYFPGHDLISGQEVALSRFPLNFLTDALPVTTPVV